MKAEFSTSLLLLITHQFSLSHDPSEIIPICWFYAQKTNDYFQCWKQSCTISPPKILWWI